jgi:anti-sigma regulatory factor (Ser/Thr protein kinase)
MYLALDRGRVTITAEDAGPGIPDVEAALQEGFSTATEWIRSLGFGAGMGLPNTRRVADEFSVESAAGTGTKVTAVIYVEAKHEAE